MRYEYYQPVAVPGRDNLLEWWTKEKPADRPYHLVYEDELPTDDGQATDDAKVLEFLFKVHNVGYDEDGNRPHGSKIRSMSVGDIVRFPFETDKPERVYVCETMGWRRLGEGEIPELQK